MKSKISDVNSDLEDGFQNGNRPSSSYTRHQIYKVTAFKNTGVKKESVKPINVTESNNQSVEVHTAEKSLHWTLASVWLLIFLLLASTSSFNVYWYLSYAITTWTDTSVGPAILCVIGCIIIFTIDMVLSFYPAARHPIVTWIFLLLVWASVQLITLFIGAKCRTRDTDNMLILVVTPGVIACGVVLQLLWATLLRMNLTKRLVPFLLVIGGTLGLLIVMTCMTWGALRYEIYELFICWVTSLFYTISMLYLLQIILKNNIYEIYEDDMAVLALLLFISPYSLLLNLLRYTIVAHVRKVVGADFSTRK